MKLKRMILMKKWRNICLKMVENNPNFHDILSNIQNEISIYHGSKFDENSAIYL